MKSLYLLITVTFLYISTTNEAHAYLDPGTGSLLLQGFIAAFITIMATAKLWWYKVKSFFITSEADESKKTEERTDNQP